MATRDDTGLLEGTVDMHAHCGPSLITRTADGYECARDAAQVRMDGIVLKEHFLPTVYGVPYIDRLLPDSYEGTAIGSVVLNYCNGGFNPFMVQTALDFGAKVVWAPTMDAKHHASRSGGLGKQFGIDRSDAPEYRGKDGLYALTESGELKDDVRICLDKIIEADAVFAVGHLSFEEMRAIAEYTADRGHDRVVIDHPNYYVTDLNREQQQALIDLGAYVNFPFCAIAPRAHWLSTTELYENIRDLGVDNCIVTSDLGQVGNPDHVDGFRMFGDLLLEEGLSEAEFRTLAATNPKYLLDMA